MAAIPCVSTWHDSATFISCGFFVFVFFLIQNILTNLNNVHDLITPVRKQSWHVRIKVVETVGSEADTHVFFFLVLIKLSKWHTYNLNTVYTSKLNKISTAQSMIKTLHLSFDLSPPYFSYQIYKHSPNKYIYIFFFRRLMKTITEQCYWLNPVLYTWTFSC